MRQRLGTTLGDNELIFTSSADGKTPLRPNTVSRAWENVAKKTGIKVIRFHDARHTNASHMLKQNTNITVISRRLGHSSIAITADTYGHLLQGVDESTAARFDAAMSETYNEMVTS